MPDKQPAAPMRPILILGGGIHGAAIARELALNGVPVIVVDSNDLATGATSKSSRLIHGGLRYLEYGDVRLVRESLTERELLLTLAPQFVRPLRLFVPTRQRWSGLLRSALGFFKLARTRFGRRLMGRSERRAPRGYWPVRLGLWMYDLFSWGDGLPKSRGMPVAQATAQHPRVDATRYRWLCAYSDAQMLYPERCVMALLADAEQLAQQRGCSFQVITHAQICWSDSTVLISKGDRSPLAIQPELVVNCSGAWGDLTLNGIDAGTTPLFAGTKGSHFITRNKELKSALGDQGVYAETGDRRLAFILPFGDAVLVGTTDELWSGPPDQAVATEEELTYLRDVVEGTFGLRLTAADIESHYSGVRPLPRTTDTSNAAISRDHAVTEHRLHGISILTLVGGKLTTFRSVAEQIANHVLKVLQRGRTASTNQRALPGGEDFPRQQAQWPALWQAWATEAGSTAEEAAFLWPLLGMRTRAVMIASATASSPLVTDTPLRRSTVHWLIEHEWADRLDDLVERRLMLIFAPRLSHGMLGDLAECLVEAGRLSREHLPTTVSATIQRLKSHYGRTVTFDT